MWPGGPAIGRFVQADSVVPNPGSAIGFDRYSYAYAYNNPLHYTDPSGHVPVVPSDNTPCIDGVCLPHEQQREEWALDQAVYGNKNPVYPDITFVGNWGDEEILEIYYNLDMLYNAASPEFIENYVADLNLRITKLPLNYGYQLPIIGITLNTNQPHYGQTFMHELWHEIDDTSGFFYQLSEQFEDYVGSSTEHIYYGEHGLSPRMDYTPAPGWPIYGGGKPPNRREDLAESAMEYFYKEARNISEDGLRWKFIEVLLTTGQPPTP